MTISRCERVLIGIVLAAAVNGCDAPPARKAPANSLAAILEETDSRVLSGSLSRFIDARKSNPGRLDRDLRAGGFRRSDEKPGCVRYAYTGEREQIRQVVDNTLHILIEQCGSAPRTENISIWRGDSPKSSKAPTASLSAILKEPDSDALSSSLRRFIDARKSDPACLDRELRAGGFRRSDERPGCVRYAYTGEREQFMLVVDDTLRILIEQCGSKPRTETISIRRGNK